MWTCMPIIKFAAMRRKMGLVPCCAVALGVAFGSSVSVFGRTVLTTQSPDQSLYAATLSASITSSSDDTSVWFEWGADTNYGQLTSTIVLASTNTTSVSNLITGLTAYTLYHYQAVASNVSGTVFGGDVSFTTVPKFVQVGTNTDWSAFVLSGDGHELVATLGGIIYISTNLGVTFSPTTGTGSVFAVSSNGMTILASSGTNIYVSMDRGATWTTNNAPIVFSIVASSSDAQTVVACDGGLTIYTSTNFGETWSYSSVSAPDAYPTVSGLACSGGGGQIYGTGTCLPGGDIIFGWIFRSTDSGLSWATEYEISQGDGGYVACSGDGSIVYGGGGLGGWISRNGGSSWSSDGRVSLVLACSGDGKTSLIVGNTSTEVSPDTGTNWYSANAPYFPGWAKLMSSGDGKTLAAFDGTIYLSLPPGSQPSVLSLATNAGAGMLTFQVTGQVGDTYTVQESTNLLDWTNVAVLVNTNGNVPFTVPASTNFLQRYYRAVAH